jgi:hypothetical protein
MDASGVPGSKFRAELEDGQVVETDGTTIADPDSGDQVPAVVLRMTHGRAHVLAHVLTDWSRVALTFASMRSSAAAEQALARTLDAGAAVAGHPGAVRCAERISGVVSTPQRMAAVTVLKERETRLSPLQRLAVVDSAARWMGEDDGDELAWALLDAVCSDSSTTNHVYLALLDSGAGEG